MDTENNNKGFDVDRFKKEAIAVFIKESRPRKTLHF